ncbi:peptidylprolyl isomerase [Ligilactobacillus agilis]|uniref:Peptidyl-prolyl cis-trans isomerase n=2 Tax=Ligilactobacillus agilis TaxID=1601 RepID=A0A0R2AH53_9LACO|nr:peptidylprolyl isomerase [Ligilactobacillus agilis]KRM63257.1 peptidyl-prolyl cis-trans isomerase [Ligilactobacillus agilis DSM 20509]MDO4598345.1 peptidylprolyl isomerase [Ligilactobacillus agilis]OXC08899.1 peptidylprolyl isomerase [Ligilactobacillus agilis]OXC09571.1 peptidylprolyl isomerase [Ligilactobacillus agilis]OXC11716.1 peptidylprolyl isomerase [Ligilactobacillus agilis]
MYPQLNLAAVEGPVATFKTNKGDFAIKLFPKQAPKTVENFLGLVAKNYYDGIIFHRVIKDFMIQGGDPTGTGMGGQSLWGTPFEDEFSNELFNIRGALSMANAGPATNGSQFFIVQNQNMPAQMEEQMVAAGYPKEIIEAYRQGGTPWLDHRHTVFGQVVSGMEIVDEIANVETGIQDKPVEDVVIKTIEVSE